MGKHQKAAERFNVGLTADEIRTEKRNTRTKNRNIARKEFRQDHPEYSHKKLNRWPLPIVE